MADEEQPKKTKKWGRRIKNIGITILEKVGFSSKSKGVTGSEPQYELYEGQDVLEIQPVKRLKERNLLGILESRSSGVSSVEANWDAFEKEGEFVDQVKDLYADSMIYLDAETGKYEFGIYQNGVEGDDEEIGISVKGVEYKYPVPPMVKLRYSIPGMKRNWIVTVSPFGYNKMNRYVATYKTIINQICDDVQNAELANANNAEERDRIISNIKFIRQAYESIISDLLICYCGSAQAENINVELPYIQIEKKQYSFVKEATEKSLEIPGFYDKFSQKRFRRDDFIYYNTFNVIRPVLYGAGKDSYKVEDELGNGHNWQVRGDELGPGLDKFGYPLEVDDDGYVMIDKRDEDGKPTPSTTWRERVPSQFIKRLDLLETVNYIDNHHDTYRDDLRDGRYHPFSATIMDYVQANNNSLWDLWSLKKEEDVETQETLVNGGIRITGQSKFTIPLNKDAPDNKKEITISPSDKNPAFDFRFIKGLREGGNTPQWKHAGRRYYYDVPDGVMSSHNTEAHLSSRGVSMYIIEKLTRRMRKFDETIRILNEIGQRGGFDYGTRPWDLWGRTMIPNIYNWRNMMADVNKMPSKKPSASEYKQKYSIS